ncbi:1-(5-phosphoribosyl)-5-((5-phosphoribosylamino)methylideneamino)imidazole-4-carboxamideisomerase [Dehalogenimonas formicexedens]|uniref:1-(5-phosphoribosyl)-5-[(5-phosphoribosylamino)methylideneamino] imidazole-4-carboxamide isomerase n=1 Tax=Dehalogenimonas formicexedens TaxID=1839801 RepID=A0A1P8F8M4_9CHLR|nr:1-(5-phosphoribosyl)-5-[(5-phosphoribosylamino)methylideneamino]imidazole-4-carboxamide isomerase [Dehalogenimonas formicexedens]APV44829.1 1-(5-phosphoribosyl)-5-((5-phosphoribosylamino)methylideneamino)imidazole-4-carboxamideisomerase [Dehalogenimonas formicexedens]
MREPNIEIIPAIDIRGGRCVRLVQGDYSRETVYSDNPLEMALKWQSMGASRLHIVDLDGAASGEMVNFNVISQIAAATQVPVQIGGGIRDIERVKKLLSAGIDRVILGTAAVENPAFVQEACGKYPESVIVSLDAREGKMAVKGWQEETDLPVLSFARQMMARGVRRFVFTDISRDGMLTEPNFTALFELIQAIRAPVIASGGIASISHLQILKLIGAEAAILGKSIYSGAIDLRQALKTIDKS